MASTTMRLFAVSNQLLQASAKRSLQTSAIARKSVAERAAETKAAAEKMKKLQEAFQKDDGLPVHLKKGASDKFLYYTTWVLIGVGAVMSGDTIYQLMYPQD